MLCSLAGYSVDYNGAVNISVAHVQRKLLLHAATVLLATAAHSRLWVSSDKTVFYSESSHIAQDVFSLIP